MTGPDLRAARLDLPLAPVESVALQFNHADVDGTEHEWAMWVQPAGDPDPDSAVAVASLTPGDGVTTGTLDVSELPLGVDHLVVLTVGSGWAMGRCVRSRLSTERQVHEVELSFAEVGIDLTLVVGPGSGGGGVTLPIQQSDVDGLPEALAGKATAADITAAVGAHAGATDPHGDRAYTDAATSATQFIAFTNTTVDTAPAFVVAGPGVTVTLPDAESFAGKQVTVSSASPSLAVTVACAGSDVFDFTGATSVSLASGSKRSFVAVDLSVASVPGVTWMWAPAGRNGIEVDLPDWSGASQGQAVVMGASAPEWGEPTVEQLDAVEARLHDVISGLARPEPARVFRFTDHTNESESWRSTDVPAITVTGESPGLDLRARVKVRRSGITGWFHELWTRTFDGEGLIDSPELGLNESTGGWFDHDDIKDAFWLMYEWVHGSSEEESDDRAWARADVEGFWATLRSTHDFTTGKVKLWIAVRDASQTTEITADGTRWRLIGENAGGDTGIEFRPDPEPWAFCMRFLGEAEWGQIYDGIDGTLIASPSAADCTPGDTSFTDGQGNTWATVAGACVASTEERLEDLAEHLGLELIDRAYLASDAAEVELTGLAEFSSVLLIVEARSDRTSNTAGTLLTCNDDTGTNYAQGATTGNASCNLGVMPAASATAGRYSWTEVRISNHPGRAHHIVADHRLDQLTASGFTNSGFAYTATDPVDTVQIFSSNSANLVAGTCVTALGVRA